MSKRSHGVHSPLPTGGDRHVENVPDVCHGRPLEFAATSATSRFELSREQSYSRMIFETAIPP